MSRRYDATRRAIDTLRRRAPAPVWRRVRVAADLVRNADGVDPYDLHTNGEAAMLRRAGAHAEVALDIGANVGDWSQAAVDAGVARVHCCEIAPATAEIVRARFADDDRVSVHATGLSDTVGTVPIAYYPGHSVLTSTSIEVTHDHAHEVIDAPVTTGDRLVEDLGLERIDIVKIDTEGAEPAVLRGFDATFAAERIGLVQFEYGLIALVERFLLEDYYAFFEARGFEVGPVGPDGVAFGPYQIGLANFSHPNFVAVHRSRPDLRSAVAVPRT